MPGRPLPLTIATRIDDGVMAGLNALCGLPVLPGRPLVGLPISQGCCHWYRAGLRFETCTADAPPAAVNDDQSRWTLTTRDLAEYAVDANRSSVESDGDFPPDPMMLTLCEMASSMSLMNGRSVRLMPLNRADARASKARRNVCWRACRWKSSSVCRYRAKASALVPFSCW